MYTLLRRIHLYAGLVIMTFLLMYFLTGYAIIHRTWLVSPDYKPATITRTQSLANFTGQKTPEALAQYLGDNLNLHGRLILHANPPGPQEPLKFSLVRPSSICQVELPTGAIELTLKTTDNNLQTILAQLHRIHGYGGGWLFNLWALLNDLASLSCILFALTGVYLWWKSTKNHTLGILCLTLSCAYGLGMILYLQYAR